MVPPYSPLQLAVEKDDLCIPLIDFSPFYSGTPSDKHALALSMTNALKASGFLYLKSHGIPPSVVSRVFAASAHFFARPQMQKDELGWTTPQSNRGYVAVGRERLAGQMDLKETMEIGLEGVVGHPNHWPDHFDDEGRDFKELMLSFFDMCKNLHVQIMSAIALGMRLPVNFFDAFIDHGDNNLRLLHYPPVRKDLFHQNLNQVRAGEHSDYGSITLLFQDCHGGLQVRSPKGTFVDVIPIADTIIVNAGDLLARWSNDTIRSTRHRVIEPPRPVVEEPSTPTSESYPSRYSIAYFCNPNRNAQIEALPGTFGEYVQRDKKYEAITAGEYLLQRLTATI
ncbi:hypothetical protein N7474_000912 [Penicillium riverlandense]|uniref:uncharacterized protein n=1 Tax=Penicillium riverlandense TaxID=1903569 RepID=UPI002549BB38|nr:uncharacterized protein N7474_000912 [Penicillium riverlandense]KAJ5832601.1 hypothetical protein N7474_000912 [Penicillium riverlandense]